MHNVHGFMRSDVAVYIPVYNGMPYLEECLTAVFAQSYAFSEVIIIDDCSTDGLNEWMREQTAFSVRYVRLPVRSGIAAVRNKGIYETKTPFLASIDVDCVIEKDWLSRLMGHFADDTVVGAGGVLIEKKHTAFADQWRTVHMTQQIAFHTTDVPFLPGCNAVYRRDVLREIGGYRDDYRYHHEDTDAGERLYARGWRLRYDITVPVRHIKHDTVTSVMRSCWGFRHRMPLCSWRQLVKECLFEHMRGVKLFWHDLISGRYRIALAVDLRYGWYQSYFSWQSYRYRHCNF